MGPGPFLEGSVAGTASAQAGSRLAEVVRSIASALEYCRDYKVPEAEKPTARDSDGFLSQVLVVDDAGLHARPAAMLPQLAAPAPASRAAARIVSISWSVSAGTTGETMTRTGIPAAASARITASRRSGAGTRGSIFRATPRSSVVTPTPIALDRKALSNAIRPI